MTDIFAASEGNTELSEEERLELIPSLTTRAELNAIERFNINAARVWVMRPRAATARPAHRRLRARTAPAYVC